MDTQKRNINLLPALLLMGGLVVFVAIGGIFAFSQEEETIQGQAEVTEYRVSSKVPGRILEYRVKEGDRVRKGDTLAIIEAPEIAAKMTQARAAEQAAEAQNRKAEKGARAEQIAAAHELWNKAKAAAEVAVKSYNRIKRLADQGVIAAQKLDEVTAQRDAAIATERAAKASYDMAVNGAELEDKQAAQALVSRARGAVEEVEAYVAETYLLASHDGEVSEIYPLVGELVGTGAPIMSVALLQDMWVSFNVREDHLEKFAIGKEIEAVVPALSDRRIQLRVYHMKDLGSYAAWKATKTTGQFDMKTFEVKAAPITPVEGLRPGMSVLY